MCIYREEEWKTVKDFPRYEVSFDGKIRFKKTKAICATSINNSGYEIMIFYKGLGKRVCKPVHRVVAEAFIPNPENYSDVDHINTNKLDNSASNLQWLSHQDNCRKAVTDRQYWFALSEAVRNNWDIHIGYDNCFKTEYGFSFNNPVTGKTSSYFMHTWTDKFCDELETLEKLFPGYNFTLYLSNGEMIEANIKGTPRKTYL